LLKVFVQTLRPLPTHGLGPHMGSAPFSLDAHDLGFRV